MVKVNDIPSKKYSRLLMNIIWVIVLAVSSAILLSSPQRKNDMEASQSIYLPVLYEIPPFTIILRDGNAIRMEIFVETENKKDIYDIKQHEVSIKQRISNKISNYPLDILLIKENRKTIQSILTGQVNLAVSRPTARNVYYNIIPQ